MPDERAEEVTKRYEQLKGDRGTWESHWQQCANYLQPERATYTVERTPGQKVMSWVFDETPLWALDQFANGMHAFGNGIGDRWFGMEADDDAINADYDCRAWMDACSDAMYRVFSSPRYNFATASHELYLDLGCTGTAAMAMLETPDGEPSFSTRHLRECVIAENDNDRIDTIVRRWHFTAKQAQQRWGDAAGEKVLKAIANGKPDDKFWFLQQIKPRLSRDPQRADAKHKAFESVYVSEADFSVIAEGGFDQFPFLVPRFSKSSGEVYGRSVGMRSLPSVKMLNSMARTIIKAAQKIVDPPLMVPDDGYILPIRTTPGGMIYFRSGLRQTDRIMPLETKGDLPIGREMMNDLRQLIIRGFYVDWFIMPSDMTDPASDGKGVTATFTTQQRREKMRQSSAMMARLNGEFNDPAITRLFAMLFRKSKMMRFGMGSPFPPPPVKMRNAPWHIRYLSPLAIAQKGSELDAVSQTVQSVLGLMQVDPQAGQVIDSEAIIRRTVRDLNAPVLMLRSPAVMAQMRADAARQQQAAQQQQEAMSLAKAGKDGAGALQSLASVQANGAAQGAVAAGFGPQPLPEAA